MIPDILIMSLVCVLGIGFVVFVCAQRGVVKICNINLCKEEFLDDYKPIENKKFALLMLLFFVAGIAVQYSLRKNTDTVGMVKLTFLYFLIAASATVDGKRKIIPNIIIIIGLIFRLGMYVYEFFRSDNFKIIINNDILGVLLGFGVLCFISLVFHGAVGMGDAKLFGVIGATLGVFGTYSTLFVSLIASVVTSLTLFALKKIGKKDSLPFAPFIAIGYFITVMVTSY